jgi:hypothetical protein
MVLLITGAVIVLLLLMLRVADRHDIRRGHRPRRMGDIRSATRQQRRDLRAARSARYLPGERSAESRGPSKPKHD